MLVSEAVERVRLQGGFDTSAASSSAAVIEGWVHDRVQRALARSKWRRMTIELGPTVAGQASYALPDHVVDLRTLRVGASRAYARESTQGLWELASGDRYLTGVTPGAFAGSFGADTDAVAAVELWPVPEESGLAISALAAIKLPAGWSASELQLPDDLAEQIAVDGAIATGLRRIEERHDDAASFEASFEAGVKELSRRTNSRVGSGAHQIPITRP